MTLAARHAGTNPWLADDAIVFRMCADPIPEHALGNIRADCAMVRADPHGSMPADVLEVEGRVARISLQQIEVLLSDRLDGGRQRFVAPPELGGGAVD